MSDQFDDHDDDETQESEPNAIKALREQNRRLEKELKANADARKELAMLKAGIDTSTPLGKFFAENFKGDASDVEAVKVAAREIGVLANEAAPAAEGAQNATPASNPESTPHDSSTDERLNLSNGSMPNDGSGIDPRAASLDKANKLLGEGRSFDVAAGELLAERAKAAMSGDERVMWKGHAF